MGRTRQNTRRARRVRRHQRIRRRVRGSSARPRLVMFRSLKNIEGQIIDDVRGITLLGLSTLASELRERRTSDGLSKTEISRTAGKMLAERAREQGIEKVVFDRGGYQYHGRVKAFAEGAREGGLDF